MRVSVFEGEGVRVRVGVCLRVSEGDGGSIFFAVMIGLRMGRSPKPRPHRPQTRLRENRMETRQPQTRLRNRRK